MKDNFIVIGPTGEYTVTKNGVFQDIVEGKVEHAVYLYRNEIKNKLLWFLCQVPGSLMMNKHFFVPFNDLNTVNYSMVKKHLKKNCMNYIVFVPSTVFYQSFSNNLIKKLKKSGYPITLCYYFIDGLERTAFVMNRKPKYVLDFLKQFDVVATYDPTDAKKYHLHYVDIPVYQGELTPVDAEYDLYFNGRDKKRTKILLKIDRKAKSEGLKNVVHIANCEKPELYKGKVLTGWVNYKQIIEETKKTRCIVEILAEHNFGTTLRYKEAIMYNKKLITNNKRLPEMELYDERYMKYFASVEDIDFDWIKNDEVVDYGYQGEFSAEVFLQKMKELCNKK